MPNEAVEIAKFSKRGKPLEVEVVVGEAMRAHFEIDVYDKAQKQIQHEEGDVEEGDPTKFEIDSSLEDLNGGTISWWLQINANARKKGQKYSATVYIRQDNRIVENGKVLMTGTFDTVSVVVDAERGLKAE